MNCLANGVAFYSVRASDMMAAYEKAAVSCHYKVLRRFL
jgi:hypothetical protein